MKKPQALALSPSPRARSLAPFGLMALVAAGASGCATSPRPQPHTAVHAMPESVDGGTVVEMQRMLDETAPGDRARDAVRARVTAYLARRGLDAAHTGDHAQALRTLRSALVHYAPEEIAAGSLPRELGPLAEALLAWAEPRGDEARALIAARVLMAVEGGSTEAARATYARISEWGSRNREDFQRPWVREGELSEVWTEVARVVPARDVLDAAAEHLIARRRMAREGQATLLREQTRPSYDEVRQLRAGLSTSGAELAILFLRVGDVREAANRLRQFGPGSEATGLADVLGSIAQGEGGADALAELGERLERIEVGGQGSDRRASAGRAERIGGASAGVCRLGRRAFPTDPRFARCLAAAAFRERDAGLNAAHLEAAYGLSPETQSELRRAIEGATLWLSQELGADDLSGGRRAYTLAADLVGQWRRKYAGQVAPVAEADLEEAAAQLELSGGDLTRAQAHLERATRAEPASRDAFYTLAEIAWRHGDHAAAMRHLEEGLRLPLRPSESDSVFRPLFQVRQAMVTASSGDRAEAERRFREAEQSLDALSRVVTGPDLSNVMFQLAVVRDALGDTDRVRSTLDAALDATPDSRDAAARAVTFCLVRGRWADARDLARRARAQLTLDRPWTVYFGLWGSAAARIGRLSDDGGAGAALERVTASTGDAAPWTTRIAQHWLGTLDRAGLERYARTPGHRAEMFFYASLLHRAGGDNAAAEADLRAVVATEVLRYFEYEMAWEMLARGGLRAPAAPPASPATR
jgi:tetratricopeptide (TPR) repeat protein